MAKAPPVLQWMRQPLDVNSFEEQSLDSVPFLHPGLMESLRNVGIHSLFPVQAAVWHETVGPGGGARDLSISSPTGSGKTLAYSLPIAQSLSQCLLRRLRALIVVPTRDLAMQVKQVFDAIAPSVGLSVGIAVGQTSVAAEASQLVLFPGKIDTCFRELHLASDNLAESRVDILVATPGRLMDHIQNTPGFTLEHLQYLVVDETDRLLREAYQEWLPTVLEAASAKNFSPSDDSNPGIGSVRTIRRSCLERGIKGCVVPRLQKIIVSATLTRDPAKIAQLRLYHPLSVALSTSDNLYKLPEQLRSYTIICKAQQKPLKLVTLLHSLGDQRTVIFTSSVSNTHRLSTFLACFEDLPFRAVEYSSFQHQLARSKALAAFRAGEAQVLVASDAMARGMDVEGVTHIINYDMPPFARTYVHRVGRTARAGRSGSCFTLLRKEEVRYFKSILAKVQNSSCKTYKVSSESTKELRPRYWTALQKLKEILDAGAGKKGHEMYAEEVTAADDAAVVASLLPG
ncbi:hypothetical protein SELMODRAFT_109199 [Selaginella moellendorffii]|uniref:ATP-dependent RNA helicase n=1 Tax=Selaginella moellendorffii TaxID=88036 RepID=D8S637_SELML|nr:DEAD-box ATP-dependent RNA helicase 1 [Selaginella moellendorffii]EFJ20278.1 hypothetical protein SELMODRAFT_109199 [Selaginella moellendorffii]|eukprot:XP_002978831.1 DEAD-box ATP-dependent RNA helicase 1 [Selaginella moellendorffii]